MQISRSAGMRFYEWKSLYFIYINEVNVYETGRKSVGWISALYRICIWVPEREKAEQLRIYKSRGTGQWVHNGNPSSCGRTGRRGNVQGLLLCSKGRFAAWNFDRQLQYKKRLDRMCTGNRRNEHRWFGTSISQNRWNDSDYAVWRFLWNRVGWSRNPPGEFQGGCRNQNCTENTAIRNYRNKRSV